MDLLLFFLSHENSLKIWTMFGRAMVNKFGGLKSVEKSQFGVPLEKGHEMEYFQAQTKIKLNLRLSEPYFHLIHHITGCGCTITGCGCTITGCGCTQAAVAL